MIFICTVCRIIYVVYLLTVYIYMAINRAFKQFIKEDLSKHE